MTDNPIELARRLGASIGGKLGEIAFQELELAFVNVVLSRFSNNPLIRPRQHVLLYWSQSYHKSTIINEFAKVIPDSIPQLNVTTNSPPTLFGSIDDSCQINYPLFANVRIAKISELSTFVTTGNYNEIINPMNKILEGERVERQLLKLSRRNLSEDEITKVSELGVQYDPMRGELGYVPDITVFCASRPLNNKEYTRLKSSGYLFRHHIIQRQLTDKEVAEYLKANYSPDQSLYAPLKTINERVAAAKINRIDTPSDRINEELMENLVEIAQDHVGHRKDGLSELIDLRTKGDIFRELAAYSAIQACVLNEFRDIDKLEYTQDDVDFILGDIEHFIEAKIHPLFTEDLSKTIAVRSKPIELAQNAVLDFLDYDIENSRAEIDHQVLTATGVSKATLSNALAKLVREGKILNPRFGYYKQNKTE